MQPAELGDQPRHENRSQRRETPDGKIPGNTNPVRTSFFLKFPAQAQEIPGVLQESGTGPGQRNALRMMADEQVHSKLVFQFPDSARNRWLRNVKFQRSRRNALAICSFLEVFELA
jgi:hypothetical protein